MKIIVCINHKKIRFLKNILLDNPCKAPHIVNTNVGFTKRNNTKNVATQIKLSKADIPMKNVAAGLTDVQRSFQFPSQKNLYSL